jgi:hypothetical protein
LTARTEQAERRDDIDTIEDELASVKGKERAGFTYSL